MAINSFQRTVALLCLVLLALTFSPVSAALAGTYRLVTLEYPPYEYTEDGEVKGAAVDVVKETFKLMGYDVKIEVFPWARSIEMLKSGEADGIFTFFKTREREDFALFSKEVIVTQKISLWVKKDSNIVFNGDVSSLRNYKFGAVKKTSYGDIFDTAVKNGTLKVYESYTIEDCIKQLDNNRVDIWVGNYNGAMHVLKKQFNTKDFKALVPSIQEVPSYVGFSKKRNLEELRNDFDKALRKLKVSGRYDKIMGAYK